MLILIPFSWVYEWRYIFFFNDTATTEIYTLSLHDALPIHWDARDRPANRVGPQGRLPEHSSHDREVGVAIEIPGNPRHHDVPAEAHRVSDRPEVARPGYPVRAPDGHEERAHGASDDRADDERPPAGAGERQRQRAAGGDERFRAVRSGQPAEV